MTRRILATSGGFLPTNRWGVMVPGRTILEGLRLTGKERPRVCLVLTASGDSDSYLSRMYSALSGIAEVDHLALFTMPNREPDEILGRSDLIWVGGGSVANLLALWSLHGVDEAMRNAWDNGTVLAGVSAGSICWHVGGPTDSFGPTLAPVTNALGLIPYGNGVHYDSEAQRRPMVHSLVANGTLPTTFATDDGIGLLYEGTEPVEVIADSPSSQSAAYRIERVGGETLETRLEIGRL